VLAFLLALRLYVLRLVLLVLRLRVRLMWCRTALRFFFVVFIKRYCPFLKTLTFLLPLDVFIILVFIVFSPRSIKRLQVVPVLRSRVCLWHLLEGLRLNPQQHLLLLQEKEVIVWLGLLFLVLAQLC